MLYWGGGSTVTYEIAVKIKPFKDSVVPNSNRKYKEIKR